MVAACSRATRSGEGNSPLPRNEDQENITPAALLHLCRLGNRSRHPSPPRRPSLHTCGVGCLPGTLRSWLDNSASPVVAAHRTRAVSCHNKDGPAESCFHLQPHIPSRTEASCRPRSLPRHRPGSQTESFVVLLQDTQNTSVSCCKGVDRYGVFDGHCIVGSMGAPEAFSHKVRSIFQGFSARGMPISCRKLSFKTQVLLHDELGAFSGEYLTHRLQLDMNSQLSRSWWLSRGRQDHLFDLQKRSPHRRPMIELGRDSRCISRVQVHISDIHSPAWTLHAPYNTPCSGNGRSYPCSNFPVIFKAIDNPPRKSNNYTSWVEIIHPTYQLPLQVFLHRPSYRGPSGPSLHPPALPPVPQLRAGRFPPQRRRPLQRRRIKERSSRSRSLTEHRLETHRCCRRRFHSAPVPPRVRLDLGDRAGLRTEVAQVAECFKEVTLALLAEDPPEACLGG